MEITKKKSMFTPILGLKNLLKIKCCLIGSAVLQTGKHQTSQYTQCYETLNKIKKSKN